MPFNGDEAAVVLPMSSRMLTSSPICRSSASDEAVHSKRPPDPWARATVSCESAPDEEPMCALRAVTALAASATLKARARVVQRNRLSAQNEGGGVWCDMMAVGDGATGGSATAKEICVCRTKTMSCPSDYFIFKILKIRLQLDGCRWFRCPSCLSSFSELESQQGYRQPPTVIELQPDYFNV